MGKYAFSIGHHAVRSTVKETVIANIPSLTTYVLGFIILSYVGILFGILYLSFIVLALVLFLRYVCTYCPSYGGGRCPSGYGTIASKLFKRRDISQFQRMFKTYIPFLSLVWIYPLLGSLFLLFTDFSWFFLALTLSFVIVGFVILPLFHKYYECKDCPNKQNCPWAK
ncbi:MAG: hypothetical protein JSV43_00960 [Methanobacteriota archaeon]|nr:MAG: hypothetical protein JSV43_00960 [Euryarchaeota archaeon]